MRSKQPYAQVTRADLNTAGDVGGARLLHHSSSGKVSSLLLLLLLIFPHKLTALSEKKQL